MDAKPQRLGRPLPVPTTRNFGDENINMAGAKQTLHKQHKSVGNIKSQMDANSNSYGLNAAPAKRQVFADVSNTAHQVLADVAPKDKEYPKSRVHAVSSRLDKTSNNTTTDKEWRAPHGGALLRPAQRGVGPLPGHNISAAPKPPVHMDMPLVKPTAAKKATFVYSDGQNNHNNASATGVESRFKNPRHFKSQPQLRSGSQIIPAVPRLSDTHTNSAGELINHDRAGLRRDVHNEARPAQPRPINPAAAPMSRFESDVNDNLSRMDDGASDAAYEDALENLASLSSSIETEIFKQEEDQESYHNRHIAAEQYDHHQNDLIKFAAPSDLLAEAQPASDQTEPEENWDVEEDEGDYYEEQGYTTGHSYTHGDNTTGQVTTIVAPKVTAKVRNELELARLHVEKTMTPDQIEEECWDTSMVAEYGDEIFEYMRNIETKPSLTPNPHYMDIQAEIMWSMRSILIDWLVQVHARFNLLPETLFLTVNCIDRFLSVKVVSFSKLQLVGATAIFVAAKYEEINCPSVQEIVYMVDGGFKIDEVLKAERFMLSMLDFELGWPGPMSFLRRISKADDYCIETRTLAKYFLEVTIMDERFVGSPPSFLAAGAHCLARLMLKKGDWSLTHTHWSGYTINQLKPLVALIYECCLDPTKHHWAVYDKYKASRYRCASIFVENEIAKGYVLDFHPYEGVYTSSPPTRTPLDDFTMAVEYHRDQSRRLVSTQA